MASNRSNDANIIYDPSVLGLHLPSFFQLEMENTTSVDMKEEVVSWESSGRPVRGDGGSDGNFEIQ